MLVKALETADPSERLSLILVYLVSSIYYGISVKKPFNPLLGETF